MVCEISQPKIAPCENGHLLRNNFAATRCLLRNQGFTAKWALRCETISQPQSHPLRKFSQLRNPHLAHECHFAAHAPILQLRNPLRITKAIKSSFSQPKLHFAAAKAPAKPTFGTRVPFRSPTPSFRSCEMGCENGTSLRNGPSSAKKSNRHLASYLNFLNYKFSF